MQQSAQTDALQEIHRLLSMSMIGCSCLKASSTRYGSGMPTLTSHAQADHGHPTTCCKALSQLLHAEWATAWLQEVYRAAFKDVTSFWEQI